ncbi:GNAT family N-acetyltransferase [Thermovirga sp.]|uniref:GNAT family N-acetyltransferase n=1 Tax=Thermovirga sp. TaxID=2699834 RepID=UPI0025CC7DC1|nr:N-acetyltransferase [Thermovirga sp.]
MGATGRVKNLDINIRNEEPKDYRRVEEVAREAFWNLYSPGCHEHFVIHKMREHDDFIKELTFVIEVDGQVEGGIFYTHSKIVSKDNTEYKTITFGPVFISPKFHRKGLGKKLITHSIEIEVAKEMGYRAILALGYPYHYKPYGFVGGKKYNISMPDGKFYKGLLVLPLYEGALDNISGYVVFSDVFDVTEEEVEEFDRSFPPKEKKYQASQDEYEAASSMLDE